MNNFKALAVAFSIVATPALAQADKSTTTAAATVALKEGAMVFSADGRRIGKVNRVKTEAGAPSAVSIIYDGRFIYVPASTLTASDRGLTSSLTKADIGKL